MIGRPSHHLDGFHIHGTEQRPGKCVRLPRHGNDEIDEPRKCATRSKRLEDDRGFEPIEGFCGDAEFFFRHILGRMFEDIFKIMTELIGNKTHGNVQITKGFPDFGLLEERKQEMLASDIIIAMANGFAARPVKTGFELMWFHVGIR